jgi:antirestriction protein
LHTPFSAKAKGYVQHKPSEGLEMNQKQTLGEIRIYMACLAAYNNGYLHGRWIDATIGEDAIWTEIKEMLAASPIEDAEEHALHDYEGFEGLRLSEYEGVSEIVEKAEFIEEHGKLGALVAEHFGGSVEEAKDALDDAYAGPYNSLADFAEEMTEQSGAEIPESLRHYIDYEAMGRDMGVNDVFTIEAAFDEVHIFWHR